MQSINQATEQKGIYQNTMSTLNLIIFSLLTMGLFGYLQIRIMNKEIQQTTQQKTSSHSYIFTAGLLLGLSFLFSSIDLSLMNSSFNLLSEGVWREREDVEILYYLAIFVSVISTLLSISASILYIIWAFKMRTILTSYAEKNNITLPLNGFLTFIFNYFYINYKLNEFNQKIASSH